jgi:nucleotide-binding universal stress UspA family protein
MNPREHVLVGLGDDNEGRTELDWAAHEAHVRGIALDIVRAYDSAEFIDPWVPSADRASAVDLRRKSQEHLDAALERARAAWPELQIEVHVVDGRPAQVLVDASREAVITVVGGRQLGTIGGVLLGSVSAVVAATAVGPVVVVGHRTPPEPDAESAVVVGVDGSDAMPDVLSFAFGHADRHHLPLHALACWTHGFFEVSSWAEEHRAQDAERWLAEALAGWEEKYPDVRVRREIVHDHPVAALVTAGAGQELLVVGSHARRLRHPALLGSVSQGVLHHAGSPVAVVHPRDNGA